MGGRDLASIASLDLLPVLRRVENREAVETAHRLRQTCGQIFRHAIPAGLKMMQGWADYLDNLKYEWLRPGSHIVSAIK
ncbi:phage integrase central domain-containing protein [Desulfospira joergensenii]|uniref:phage integrase central domain-containing protein n=1 Tax=Desulfospira joergensenii TaxID=53329 RepID=UPI003CC5E829